MTEAIFTPEQLAEVKAYHLPHYIWAACGDVFRFALLFVTLRYLIRPLYRAAEKSASWLELRLGGARKLPVVRAIPAALDKLWGERGWGVALLFAIYDLLLGALLMLPLNIYFGYVLEHRHGLSNYSPGAFAWDSGKEIFLDAIPTAALAFGLYGLARRMKRWWLVLGVTAGIAMFAAAAIDPYRNQVYFDQTPLPAGPVRDRVTAVMNQANVPFRDVVVEKQSRATTKVQAYFAGQGPTRTIVMNDSLLEKLTPDEIAAAVAHEAGHVQENKWPGRVASFFAIIAVLYLVHRLILWSTKRKFWGIERYGDIRTLPLVSAVVFMAISYSAPIAGYFSRERELAADRFAVELTKAPDAFEAMLIKAARANKMDPDPPKWVVWRGWSHPTVTDRIAQVESMKAAASR
ncbi:MAG: M48 family metalloprotease [Myxococcaceae bacterium]